MWSGSVTPGQKAERELPNLEDLAWPMPWKSKTKQRMVFRMIHVKDSLLPMGKVWSLDFLGMANLFLLLGMTYLVGKISRSNFYFRVHWPSEKYAEMLFEQ